MTRQIKAVTPRIVPQSTYSDMDVAEDLSHELCKKLTAYCAEHETWIPHVCGALVNTVMLGNTFAVPS